MHYTIPSRKQKIIFNLYHLILLKLHNFVSTIAQLRKNSVLGNGNIRLTYSETIYFFRWFRGGRGGRETNLLKFANIRSEIWNWATMLYSSCNSYLQIEIIFTLLYNKSKIWYKILLFPWNYQKTFLDGGFCIAIFWWFQG